MIIMGIIEERKTLKRNTIIEIKEALVKSKNEGLNVNLKSLALEICSKFFISQRTAKEYIEEALFQLNLKKEDLNFEKQKLLL